MPGGNVRAHDEHPIPKRRFTLRDLREVLRPGTTALEGKSSIGRCNGHNGRSISVVVGNDVIEAFTKPLEPRIVAVRRTDPGTIGAGLNIFPHLKGAIAKCAYVGVGVGVGIGVPGGGVAVWTWATGVVPPVPPEGKVLPRSRCLT